MSQIVAGVALAQSAAPVAALDDYLHASGGQLELLTKSSSRLSGSFGITASRSQLPFANGTGRGYSGTLGGTIVPDRLWFFASAEQATPMFVQTPIANAPVIRMINTNVGAQVGDRQNMAASFAAASRFDPSSFLSLHYTGIVSSSSYFTATVSRGSSQPTILLPPR